MRTFSDLGFNTDIKIAIDGLVGNFSPRVTSHKGSWPLLLKSQLNHIGFNDVEVLYKNQEWKAYDVVVIDWGMEFRGTFNLFGGVTDELSNRVNQVFNTNVVSAHIPCPDLGEFVRSRRKSSKSVVFNQLDDKALTKFSENVDYFEQVFENDRLVFGDSHSVSIYRPGYMISRNDGLTLYGALKRGLSSYISSSVRDLVLYLGNIDLRFHLFRQTDPIEAVDKLLDDLTEQLSRLSLQQVTLVGLLPIEHEERKLPGTGLYMDQPFFGSREERAALGMYFNERLSYICDHKGWKMENWPSDWYDMDPKEFAETHMEAKQSVHLRRSSYMYEW